MRGMQRNALVKFLTEKAEQLLLQAENSLVVWKMLKLQEADDLLALYGIVTIGYCCFMKPLVKINSFFTKEVCLPGLITEAKIDLQEPHKC